MTLENLIPPGGMTPNDLVRLGAEFALGVEPVEVAPQVLDTPIYTGRLLAHEIQPGLMLSAGDVTYICEWCGMETKRAVREQALSHERAGGRHDLSRSVGR